MKITITSKEGVTQEFNKIGDLILSKRKKGISVFLYVNDEEKEFLPSQIKTITITEFD